VFEIIAKLLLILYFWIFLIPCEHGERKKSFTMTVGYEDRRTWRPIVQVVFDFVLYEELKSVRMNKSLSYLIVPTKQGTLETTVPGKRV